MKKFLVLLTLFFNLLPLSFAQKGERDGHEYVDLGLPSGLRWATSNIGARNSEELGDLFKCYELQQCDAADYDEDRANWGAGWRLPTMDEFKELIQNCSIVWVSIQNVFGYKFTGPNGESFFLPVDRSDHDDYTGFMYFGYYCCSTPEDYALCLTERCYGVYQTDGLRIWRKRLVLDE